MTRWSAITRTRRSCSALAYGSRSTAAADKTSTGSYTTSGDATAAARHERVPRFSRELGVWLARVSEATQRQSAAEYELPAAERADYVRELQRIALGHEPSAGVR